MPKGRTLLVGFDGGTWTLLDPARRAGALPHLDTFLKRSLVGKLRSVDPPVTIPAWYCAVTGASPATLDAWGFTAPTPEPGRFRLITTYRPHEALWDRLGRRGWRVGVVNFPTMPAPSVNGYFIGGMLSVPGAATTYPASLASRLEKEGGWSYDPASQGGALEAAFGEAVRSLERKAQVVETLQEEYAPDLLFVLLSEVDRLQHNFYDAFASFPQRASRPVQEFYRALDGAFHRVLQAFHGSDPSGFTWLLSDHGFGPTDGYFFTNRFLERKGYLVVKPGGSPGLRPRATDLMARVDAAVPMRRPLRLVDDLRVKISPRAPDRDGDALDQTFGWFSQFVDWERTRAYSFPAPEGIYANPFGPKLDAKGRAELKRELVRDLRASSAAKISVVDPEEAYGRPVSPDAPLLLIASHDHAWETRGDVNSSSEHLPRRASYVARQGTHRYEGILAVSGPSISPGELSQVPSILTIAPTVFSLLGLPVPEEMEAPPCAEVLRAAGRSPSSE